MSDIEMSQGSGGIRFVFCYLWHEISICSHPVSHHLTLTAFEGAGF